MTDFWSKAVQKIKSKLAKELLPTIIQEKTKSMKNDKTNPHPSTDPPSTTTTAASTPAKEKVNKKSTPIMIFL